MSDNMFCYQCEQAAKGTGCTVQGICGKDPETAKLQDLLLWQAKGIALYAHKAAQAGLRDRETDVFVTEALFTTVTNVNFDAKTIEALVRRAQAVKEKAKALAGGAQFAGPAAWVPPSGHTELLAAADGIGVFEGERGAAPAAGTDAANRDFGRINLDDAGAEAGYGLLDGTGRPSADLHHGDDGGHTDDNAQAGEGRAHDVAAEGVQGHAGRAGEVLGAAPTALGG